MIKSRACFGSAPRSSHPNSDGDQRPKHRDDNEGDAQRLPEGQELNDFGHTGVISLVGPVVFATQDALPGIWAKMEEELIAESIEFKNIPRNCGLLVRRISPCFQ